MCAVFVSVITVSIITDYWEFYFVYDLFNNVSSSDYIVSNDTMISE
jgi:hypothetical protein